MNYIETLENIFSKKILVKKNFITFSQQKLTEKNQQQTQDIFSDKWTEVSEYEKVEELYKFQFDWFLRLYGFDDEKKFAEYLSTKKIIIDTGCGLGYKAAWFAKLSPQSLVLGVDISDAVNIAANKYENIPNLFFFKADIADTNLKNGSIDFTVCDQVIMHTEVPENTFKHLSEITSVDGEFACYVYSKKALPRELVDDFFRKETHHISQEKMWEFSAQLTELGKRLSELNISFESPDIPLLGIKGGTYDIQRFIYWNFLKCFWRDDWGFDLCKSTNYDWYAPSNAKRFSKEEFLKMVTENNLFVSFLHEEEACYSGRFKK